MATDDPCARCFDRPRDHRYLVCLHCLRKIAERVGATTEEISVVQNQVAERYRWTDRIPDEGEESPGGYLP